MDLLQKAISLGFIPVNKDYYLWEIQKWLREKHDTHIYANYRTFGVVSCNGYYWHIGRSPNRGYDSTRYLTYEEALEVGLQEALKLI